MLGALHRVALGLAPPQLAALFPLRGFVPEPQHMGRLRTWRPLHSRQLHSFAALRCTETMSRSLFGLVPCYNKLPQKAVGFNSVKSFQGSLQNALKLFAQSVPGGDWQALYSSGWKRLTGTQLDTFFA